MSVGPEKASGSESPQSQSSPAVPPTLSLNPTLQMRKLRLRKRCMATNLKVVEPGLELGLNDGKDHLPRGHL